MIAWDVLKSKSSLLVGTAWQHLISAIQMGGFVGSETTMDVALIELTVDHSETTMDANYNIDAVSVEVSENVGLMELQDESTTMVI